MAGRFSKVDITSTFPRYYKPLSLRLYSVLENVGACTAVRDVTIKSMATKEILYTLFGTRAALKTSMYIFGSSFEGTTTAGLKSDVDLVMVIENFPAASNIADARQYPICCFLPVQDSNTPAGYCKLRFAVLGMTPRMTSSYPGFPRDADGRLCFQIPNKIFPDIERHGPAQTREETSFRTSSDLVFAVRSHTWPDCASEWLVRERRYNWPSQAQIDKCKTLGCFFVNVGHPSSDEKHLQWRFSFSLQERLLVTDFNSVQLQCYILLKMIRKEMIDKYVGEKSLTSYHFKTCMLYMKENSPAKFWTEKNLLVCLYHCLKQMLVFVETGVCPNYFIPEENMFDGRVSGQMQTRICKILTQILSADFKFLLSLKTDMLGIKYQKALESGIIAPGPGYGQAVPIILTKSYAVYESLLSLRSSFLDRCQHTNSLVFAQKLFEGTHRFLSLGSSRISEHSVTDTREVLSLLLPYVDITLLSVQAAEAKRTSVSNEGIINLLTSERWHAVSQEADPISAKLKQASAVCMLAYCDLSLEILLSLQDMFEQRISVCGCICSEMPGEMNIESSLPVTPECSIKESLRRHFIPCVVYLPAERDLTPPALCYEMDRSVGFPYKRTSPNTYDQHSVWYDWAVVDGKVLFYFLLYLNHAHLGMEENALADVDNIRRLIDKDCLLGHRETALNILGWIYKERGLTAEAERCFLGSLTVQSTHNAASIHLREISRLL